MKLLMQDESKRVYVDSTDHHFYELPKQVRGQTVVMDTKRDYVLPRGALEGMHGQAERMLAEWFSSKGEGGKMGVEAIGDVSFRTVKYRAEEEDDEGNWTGKFIYSVKVTAEQAFWPPAPVDPTGDEPPMPRKSDFIGDRLKQTAESTKE
jgi:hypothetical protein